MASEVKATDQEAETSPDGSEHSAEQSTEARRPAGLARHLRGWQAGLVAVAIALVGLVLGAPRPVPPNMVMLPVVEPRELWRIEREDGERADAAMRELLPFEVRAAGESFRQYGAAVADKDSARALQNEKELRGLIKQSREKYGDEAVLRLRAVQTRLFVAALERFDGEGKTSDELNELGGDFVSKARSAHWLTEGGKLVASRIERETLFRIRWSEIAGVRHERSFAPTLAEWRVYYRFLLRHPGPGGAAAQLEIVDALARIDLSYPGVLARGVVLFRMGRYEASEQALRAYLRDNPQGAWRLRALNYLAAAVKEVKARQAW